MPDSPGPLRSAFVEAYPRYVAGAIAGLGVEMDETLADAVVEGLAVLDARLATLERTASRAQQSSPLEAFREALRPIDRALALLGTDLPEDAGGVVTWDRYGLAPGSSQVLGPEAHAAHLQWGIEKAVSMRSDDPARPIIAVLVPAEDRDVIVDQSEALGYRVVDLPSDERVTFAIVSLDHPAANDVIAAAVGNVRVVAYGKDVDDMRRTGLRASGVWKVVDFEAVVRRLGDVLPGLY